MMKRHQIYVWSCMCSTAGRMLRECDIEKRDIVFLCANIVISCTLFHSLTPTDHRYVMLFLVIAWTHHKYYDMSKARISTLSVVTKGKTLEEILSEIIVYLYM